MLDVLTLVKLLVLLLVFIIYLKQKHNLSTICRRNILKWFLVSLLLPMKFACLDFQVDIFLYLLDFLHMQACFVACVVIQAFCNWSKLQ